MLGEQRFEVMEAGRRYKLSDGTELVFLNRGPEGVMGVSAEEVLAVVAHRLDAMRGDKTSGGRFLSLAVTSVQDAENWLARWDALRRGEVRELVQA